MLYGMKEVCARVGMTYEGLKYYCNQGLVPNMKRDAGNRRMFDERDIAWIECLIWLRKCGMGIDDMKRYLALCLEGPESIPQRQTMLQAQREQLPAAPDKVPARPGSDQALHDHRRAQEEGLPAPAEQQAHQGKKERIQRLPGQVHLQIALGIRIDPAALQQRGADIERGHGQAQAQPEALLLRYILSHVRTSE